MQAPLFIGVDIAKAAFEAARHDSGLTEKVDSNDKAIRAWLKRLPAGTHIAVESTGRLHRRLAALAYAAGMRVYVLNAAQLSYYARSIGRRAKTDRLDAQMIARYLAREYAELHAWEPPTALQTHLDDLIGQRATLVKHRTSLRQSSQERRVLKQAMARLDKAYAAAIAAVDASVRQVVAEQDTLRAQVARLKAVPGIGPLVAVAVANRLAAKPLRSADAAVAYAGLDPRTCESGTYRGRKKLSKRGDPELRRLLYVAAMAAARNRGIAPWVLALRTRGLSAIGAYNALARRLLRAAWSLLRHDAKFDLQRFVGA